MAPIATSGALSNPQEVLLNPNCTQIFPGTSQYKARLREPMPLSLCKPSVSAVAEH
jgi:hypothetical protein